MSHLFGDEHVKRYRETDGAEGHIWLEGSTILLLTTKGRRTGDEHAVPLIYGMEGESPVIVASKGGAPEDPGWYRNLVKNPRAGVQILGERFTARARTTEGDERERLWQMMNEIWPHYDEYAERTEREIPVVVLERM